MIWRKCRCFLTRSNVVKFPGCETFPPPTWASALLKSYIIGHQGALLLCPAPYLCNEVKLAQSKPTKSRSELIHQTFPCLQYCSLAESIDAAVKIEVSKKWSFESTMCCLLNHRRILSHRGYEARRLARYVSRFFCLAH